MRTLENRRRLTEDAAPTPSDDSPADLRVPNLLNTGRGAAVPLTNGTRRSSLVPLAMMGLRDQAPGLPPVSKQKGKNKALTSLRTPSRIFCASSPHSLSLLLL